MEDRLRCLISEVDELNPLIKLQLNPFGVIDRNIANLLDKLALQADKGLTTTYCDPEKLYKADKLLVEHSRWLLKAEWEKVKSEVRWSIRIWCLRNHAEEQERDYLDRYREFACGEGRLSKIDSP